MNLTKVIGIVEKNYYVMTNRKPFVVEFRFSHHTISLSDFKWHTEMSEETNAYSANLVIDGVVVGTCSNEGKGGCASYDIYSEYELCNVVQQEIAQIDNYCFPQMKLCLSDVIDSIADIMVSFIASHVNNQRKALSVINSLNAQYEELRKIIAR